MIHAAMATAFPQIPMIPAIAADRLYITIRRTYCAGDKNVYCLSRREKIERSGFLPI